eukprot:12843388-Alexandrium_andersonii.AAC.1
MSASLVGSEMCIRDRGIRDGGPHRFVLVVAANRNGPPGSCRGTLQRRTMERRRHKDMIAWS